MSTEVFAADEQSAQPVDAMGLVRLAKAVLGAQGVKPDSELSMLFVDEEAMAELAADPQADLRELASGLFAAWVDPQLRGRPSAEVLIRHRLRERIELKDEETGEIYDKAVWPAVYDRVLGVLSVTLSMDTRFVMLTTLVCLRLTTQNSRNS